jgi:hypothetical protein
MTLTKEQIERIEINKKHALELKEKRLKEKKIEDNENDLVQNIIEPSIISNEKANIVIDNNLYCQYINEDEKICGNSQIDMTIYDSFNEKICLSCKNKSNDFDYMSKSEVSIQYLLPQDSILLMKFINKPNPRNKGWASMKLYLRKHAKVKSYKRWNNEEGLQNEIERRGKEKYERDYQNTSSVLSNSSLLLNSLNEKELLNVDNNMKRKNENNVKVKSKDRKKNAMKDLLDVWN